MPRRSDPERPLPRLSLLVLLALAEGEAHGWSIIKRIGALTDGQTRPSSGSLYLAMMRLEDRGLLEETDGPAESSGPARRYYRLTGAGRRRLASETRHLAAWVAYARTHDVLPEASPAGEA
jgi:DNA-binding PadR family transcriptional regulator